MKKNNTVNTVNTTNEVAEVVEVVETAETVAKVAEVAETEEAKVAETEEAKVEDKTPTTVMVSKSAPVGKTLALHRFTVYEVKSVKELPKVVAKVLVVTNMGDKGKDNREVAEKKVAKEYKDRRFTIERDSSTAVRFSMSLETFLAYSEPEKPKTEGKTEDSEEA